MQFLPLYASCLFLVLLNNDIVDIEKLDEIWLLSFVVQESSELFSRQSVSSIRHSISAEIINGVLLDFWY